MIAFEMLLGKLEKAKIDLDFSSFSLLLIGRCTAKIRPDLIGTQFIDYSVERLRLTLQRVA